METIPNGLLAGTGIGYVVFPETVKVIGADAYNGCKNLSYIEFSDTVTDIGNYAFYGCTALDEIDIPGTVINIGQQAFMACSNLKKLTMHKGTQTMGSQAFADCNLTEVRPSQTIRVLNDGMFTGNPVKLLVVPRFCVTWDGWGNYYNTFNPSISYVPANVENFDIYTYEDATIKGVAGTAGEAEALREENVSFEALTAGIEALGFDIDAVDIVGGFVAADGVHIGIDALAGLIAIAAQGVALPLGERLHHLQLVAGGVGRIKDDLAFNAVEIVVEAGVPPHEKGRGDAGDIQRAGKLALEAVLQSTDGLLGIFEGKGAFIALRDIVVGMHGRPPVERKSASSLQ